MDSDKPVHSLKVDSYCWSLASWRPNGKTNDVDGGMMTAARKSKENFTIVWYVNDVVAVIKG